MGIIKEKAKKKKGKEKLEAFIDGIKFRWKSSEMASNETKTYTNSLMAIWKSSFYTVLQPMPVSLKIFLKHQNLHQNYRKMLWNLVLRTFQLRHSKIAWNIEKKLKKKAIK